jgi:maltooligosyltrehalose trehalohydrolase
MNNKKNIIPGIRLKEDQAHVNIWAPLADKVWLVVDSKEIPLCREEEGYWSFQGAQLHAGDRYMIRIEGKEYPDPASLSQPDGVHAASEIIDLEDFQWTDSHWNNLPLQDYIIYELHVGAFTSEGNFAAI